MFDGKYLEWNSRRIKCIIDHFGHKFFYQKKILDLGCGQADIGAALYRLGGEITGVDARQEHLTIASRKFAGIKVVKADLDQSWPFRGQKFDIVLDLALLCHLRDYEQHLINVCAATTYLVLETGVCDSDDPTKCVVAVENKGIYDNSINGISSRPSVAAIERVLTSCGMTFKRMDNSKLNAAPYTYDWQSKNDGDVAVGKRRMWFANKTGNANQTNPDVQAYTLVNGNNKPILQNSYQSAHPRVIPLPPGTLPNITHIPGTHMQNIHDPKVRHPQSPYDNWPPKDPPQLPITPNLALSQTITKPTVSGDKKFVIVIPSYKNSQWCIKNITSALDQNYNQYRIIFTDDCSPDDTFSRVSDVVNSSSKSSIVTLIKNDTRLGALENLYNMINNCQDDEIILTLDGDDWFPDNNVLNKLDTIYSGGQVWMTYGQYKNSNDNTTGVAQPYPQHIIDSNAFRNHIWSASHLRTFYAWLFKKIKKEDLMKDGNFFPMTWDFAMMFPMLEMSGNHSKFLPDILYVYNTENPINDHKVNIALQHDLDAYIRRKPKYQKISSFITFKELGKFGRIGNQFFQVAILIALADKYNDIIKANWYCHYTNKDMLSYFKHKIMHQAPLASEIEFNYKEPNFSFNEIPYHKNMNLHGYFQSELYFDHCQELIKYYFEPTDELVAKLQNKYGKYLDLNTCSLHIRRGDFVGNQTHSVCDLDYYTRAINSINSTEKIDHFLVFSDDIPWCINNFPSNYIFVDGNLDIEDLFLMSLCKHNIISNSTFSWWSAWLNKNQSKIIMAPSKWFTNQTNINDKDIYTKEMIRI